MKTEGQKDKKSKKRNKGCISMKFAVLISYIVSLTSNIIFSIIFYLTNHGFKWIGYLIHFFIVFSIIVSLKHLLLPSGKVIKKYYSISKFLTISLMSSTIFYFSIFIYMFIYKIDKEV